MDSTKSRVGEKAALKALVVREGCQTELSLLTMLCILKYCLAFFTKCFLIISNAIYNTFSCSNESLLSYPFNINIITNLNKTNPT